MWEVLELLGRAVAGGEAEDVRLKEYVQQAELECASFRARTDLVEYHLSACCFFQPSFELLRVPRQRTQNNL